MIRATGCEGGDLLAVIWNAPLEVPRWKLHLNHICKSICLEKRTEFPHVLKIFIKSRDSSVVRALGYWLDDRGSRVRFPAGAVNFSLHHRVQNGSGAHPASYPVGTRGSSPGGKAAGA
jgi:hypothetical protein